jgi:ABC-type spermidine/putrescine transport system permease subunit II
MRTMSCAGGVAMSSSNNAIGNYRTLGILWLIYGVFRIAAGLWLIIYTPVLTLMWGALLSRVPDPFTWMDMFHVYLVLAITLAAISGVFALLAGAALRRGARAARSLSLIASLMAIPGDPLGIALGVYTLVLMLPLGSAQPSAHRAQTV